MSRQCSQCGYWLDGDEFSTNQWRKGAGLSRCMECTGCNDVCSCTQCGRTFNSRSNLDSHMLTHRVATCHICYREFTNDHNLQMHMQVHQPRNVQCPVCGEQRFRSATNAVQHVESGACSACRGSDNAREAICQFVSARAPQLLNQQLIGYGGGGGAPDLPYSCSYCDRTFRQLSQQMQHEADKHGGGQGSRHHLLTAW